MSPDQSQSKGVVTVEVHLSQSKVGILSRGAGGASFVYDEDYLRVNQGRDACAIAFSMPLRAQPYTVNGTNLHPFFAGLLPEGLQLKALFRALKTSEDDLFSMLVAVGKNTVGDVWVKPRGAKANTENAVVDLSKIKRQSFKQLLNHSTNWNEYRESRAVAGVQPKVSAGRNSMQMRSRSNQHEYILKFSSEEQSGLVENEYFFMKMASSIGLRAAKVKLIYDIDGEPGLLVERFDRVFEAGSKTATFKRIHQEDVCQIVDRYPADKYRLSLREVSNALDACSAPVAERLKLLQLQALSYLVGNGDLHAKNISVHRQAGHVGLTPIYDLLSTLPYGDSSMALKMDGRDKKLDRTTFIDFGERIGIRKQATQKMLDALMKGVAPFVDQLGEIGLAEKKEKQLRRAMLQRLSHLSS